MACGPPAGVRPTSPLLYHARQPDGGPAAAAGGIMRIAITGTRGTLGSALERQARAAGHAVLPLNFPAADITNVEALDRALGEFGPAVVLHPAAYTDVD